MLAVLQAALVPNIFQAWYQQKLLRLQLDREQLSTMSFAEGAVQYHEQSNPLMLVVTLRPCTKLISFHKTFASV